MPKKTQSIDEGRRPVTRSIARPAPAPKTLARPPAGPPAPPKAQAAAAGRYAGLANRAANPPPTALQRAIAPVTGPLARAGQQIGQAATTAYNATVATAREGYATAARAIDKLNKLPPELVEGKYSLRAGTGPAAAEAGRYRAMQEYARAQGRATVAPLPTPRPANTWQNNIPADQRNNPNWRNENAAMLMTGQEYITRNNARLRVSNPNSRDFDPTSPFFQASLSAWWKNAITAANQGQNMQTWEAQNPRPYAYWEPTADEIASRNAALALSGNPNVRWTPYGSGYTEVAELEPLPPGGGTTDTGNGWEWPEGGGSGYDYTPELLKWWNQMAMWSFSPQDYNKG